MDNASKALIMAGAILISIAIVGVGVYIFSSTSSLGNTAGQQIDATQAQMTNSTLRQYESTRVKGTTVKEFLGYADVLNTNKTLPVDLKVKLDGTELTAPFASATVVENAYYTIKITDDQIKDGYLDTVTITKNT
ncbi:MAG: hypothetical protein IKJ32_03825 [Clostridia bacterium]|nr:hypothetical protein [Clostridia bacterium]